MKTENLLPISQANGQWTVSVPSPSFVSYIINCHPLVCNLSGLVQLWVCAKFLADLECYMSIPSNILWWTVHAKIESKYAEAAKSVLAFERAVFESRMGQCPTWQVLLVALLLLSMLVLW